MDTMQYNAHAAKEAAVNEMAMVKEQEGAIRKELSRLERNLENLGSEWQTMVSRLGLILGEQETGLEGVERPVPDSPDTSIISRRISCLADQVDVLCQFINGVRCNLTI